MQSVNKDMWIEAVRYLGQCGYSADRARGLIGRWRKRYDAEMIADAIRSADVNNAVAPIPYITAALKRQNGD